MRRARAADVLLADGSQGGLARALRPRGVGHLPGRKEDSVRIGELTAFSRGGDEKKATGPLANDLNRRDLDCHPNPRHPIFVFAITPIVLLFHHRDLRMTPGSVTSDISRWRKYDASGVPPPPTFALRRWYSDEFRCKNTRILFRCDETRMTNVIY